MIISKEYCKCPYCGSECEVDTSMVLASYPPQYQAFCKKCNKVIYTLCSDAYGEISMNQDADYHNDIHRIANALEKIAKHLESEKTNISVVYDKGAEDYLKKVSGEYNSVICPKCFSSNVKALSTTHNPYDSTYLIHYICEDCHKEFEV